MKVKTILSYGLIAGLVTGASAVYASSDHSATNYNADLCNLLDPSSWVYQQHCMGGFSEDSAHIELAASGRSANIITQQVLLPTVKPVLFTEGAKKATLSRTVGPALRYESARFDASGADPEADIYGGTIGGAMDINNNMTVGVMVPYDYMDFSDSAIDTVNQTGMMLYAQYNIPLAGGRYNIGILGNTQYFYSDIEYQSDDDGLNTVGFGGGINFTANYDKFITSLAMTYQYNHDDGEIGDNELFKTGANVAYLPNDKIALNGFAVWTADLTDYNSADDHENYWDVGLELNYAFTETWNLGLGYKKVLDLDNFDSDQVYIGALWKF